jgi:hypothetical protein
VGDEEEGARVGPQPLFEPEDGVQIQMVGGLVQEQQVGAAHEGLGQVEAHAPPAGELSHRLLHLFVAETQTVQQPRRAALRREGADGVQAAMDLSLAHAVTFGLGGGQLGLQTPQLGIPVHDVVEGGTVRRRGLLGHVGDDRARRKGQIARVRGQVPADRGEQRGFAGTVGSDDGCFLAGMEGEIRLPEQEAVAAAQGEAGEGQHGGAF